MGVEPGRIRSVLVVDDSPEDCAVIRRYLAAAPYRVREESTGRAGLAAYRAGPPDCLVLDYDLPDMTGLDLLDRIAGGPHAVAAAVVVLTGKGNEALAVRAIKRGVQDYLVKGQFTPEVLAQTVGDAIQKSELAAELTRERAGAAKLAAELADRAAELAAANKNKDEFLAVLAHELRNPLAPIRTGLEILRLTAGHDPAVEDTRAMMARQLVRLVRLVDDLLDVSRIARGKVELRRTAVDLADVLGRAAETVRPRMDAGRHVLEVSVPAVPVRVDGDADRLEQVVGNLLTNAAKYSEPGGRVRVAAEADGPDAVIRVTDTGIGIRPEAADRIFDLFTQADRAAGRVAEGLGLGLALVRGLAEMHGGSVAVRSDGPGRGSEFVVRLPRLRDEPADGAAADPPPAAGRPLRVLVVDADADAATSLADVLRLAGGHDVRVAFDGPAAVAEARGFRPEVALLEVALPGGMDGYEVARRLQAVDGPGGVVLMTLTGFGQDADRRRSGEAGIAAHLVKPVDPRVLAELLAQV